MPQARTRNLPATPPLQVFAAGSLREPLTVIARRYETQAGVPVRLTFGASGLLRERIERGEPAQVFASADMQHPQTLASQGGQWQTPAVFARNSLCALTGADEPATSASLLERMLEPRVRLGTSTPGADPSGDYAWALFRKAEGLRPGAFAVLDAKALKLTASSESPRSPAGRGTYAWLMDEGRADIFLTYCTNATSACREVPRLRLVPLPAGLQVSAVYGLSALGADAQAVRFARYLLSPPAQAVLGQAGFAAP